MTGSSAGPAVPAILDTEIVATLDEMLAATELERLLGRAERQLAAVDATLRAAWERGDFPAVTRTAHQLVGLAGTVACTALMEIAQKIEAASAAARPAPFPDLFAALDTALVQSLDAIRAWRRRKAV